MRNFIITLLIIASCLFIYDGSLLADNRDNRPKIAFISFIPKSIEVTHLTEKIPTILMTAFEQGGYFEIIEKKKTDSIIELSGFKIGSMKIEDLLSISRNLNVDFGLWGEICREGSMVSVKIQLFDIHTCRLCSEQKVIAFEGELPTKLREIAAILIKNAGECVSKGPSSSAEKQLFTEPPFDIKATGGFKKIKLKWRHNDVQNLSGFKIFKAKEENGSYIQVDTVKAASFTDESLSLNETVYYRIKAIYKTGQESGLSEPVMAKTSITPPPPIFLSVRPDIKSSHLEWRVRSQKEEETTAVKIKIYRRYAEDGEMKEVVSVSAEDITFTDRGLKDNTVYYYALTALNKNDSESDKSATLSVKTFPSVESLSSESGKIRRVPLKWNVYPHDVVEGYKIYRSSDRETGFKQIANIKDRTNTVYLDTEGLSDSATYWYRYSAYSKGGIETDLSAAVSATTRGQPPVPTGLNAKSREARKVTLQWTALNSPDDEIKGYLVYRSDQKEGEGEYKKINDMAADRASFTNDNPPLKDDTAYYYRISSYNSANVESPLSETVSAVTKPVPKTPAGLKSKSGAVKQVTLTWNTNPETDVKEYVVYRKNPGEKDFEKIKTVRNVTTYIDTGLKDGFEYAYAVQAIDVDNLMSDLSPHSVAVTKPRPQIPTGLRIIEQNGKKILSWDANPEKDIKQYNIYKKGFLGIPQKLATTYNNSWIIEDSKGKLELFVTAIDETELESDSSEVIIVEGKK